MQRCRLISARHRRQQADRRHRAIKAMSLPREEPRGSATEARSIRAAAVIPTLRGQIMTDLWTRRGLEGIAHQGSLAAARIQRPRHDVGSPLSQNQERGGIQGS